MKFFIISFLAYKLQSYNFVIHLHLEISEQPWSTASAVKLMLLFVYLRIIFPKISLIISICHHFSRAFSFQNCLRPEGATLKLRATLKTAIIKRWDKAVQYTLRFRIRSGVGGEKRVGQTIKSKFGGG